MNSIEQAIERIRAGGMVVVVDDEDRENEGDLIMAAQHVTPKAITFMARQACGLICLALTGQQLDQLRVPLMVPDEASGDSFKTAFTITIEAASGVTTGISAADRARTVLLASNPDSSPKVITTPGHIFPLRARPGGVLERPGHTEAAVELASLAGLWPAGVICEIMDEDGTMMRLPRLREFAQIHDLPLISIADLITYRQSLSSDRTTLDVPASCSSLPFSYNSAEPIIEQVASTRLPTERGEWHVVAYRNHLDGLEHLAFVMGEVDNGASVLVRAHSECLTGDVFGSKRCDCGEQLDRAMGQIAQEGRGVLLYLRQEGRGIGLVNKLRAYALQDVGLDTVEANQHLGLPADSRDYQVAAEMLQALGVQSVRLLTNNPRKVTGLNEWGLDVVERVPIEIPANTENLHYLETKQHKLGHLLHVSPTSNDHQAMTALPSSIFNNYGIVNSKQETVNRKQEIGNRKQ
ncbi:MAG: bifunctional 3,4-dihydroxy-2-butanone-4-phosphate synthase/GTP cyclohydrolase II [Ardenticatenaceae bacterium]